MEAMKIGSIHLSVRPDLVNKITCKWKEITQPNLVCGFLLWSSQFIDVIGFHMKCGATCFCVISEAAPAAVSAASGCDFV